MSSLNWKVALEASSRRSSYLIAQTRTTFKAVVGLYPTFMHIGERQLTLPQMRCGLGGTQLLALGSDWSMPALLCSQWRGLVWIYALERHRSV